MKKIAALLLLVLVSCLFACSAKDSDIEPRAVSGRMDLSGWDFEKNGSVDLDGDWELYWNELLNPDDFKKGASPKASRFFRIPGVWNKIRPGGFKLQGIGYATFRLFVTLPSRNDLAVAIENLSSSYRLYIDGNLVAQNGVPGKTAETTVPENSVVISRFATTSASTEIVLQVSNFETLKGGPHRSITIGTEGQLEVS